jgi:hypothetical protein
MPALVAGIHAFYIASSQVVDGRDKPGHDGDEDQGVVKRKAAEAASR